MNIRRAQPDDAETIARFNEAMALETEDKALDPATVQIAGTASPGDPRRPANSKAMLVSRDPNW